MMLMGKTSTPYREAERPRGNVHRAADSLSGIGFEKIMLCEAESSLAVSHASARSFSVLPYLLPHLDSTR